MPTFDSSLGQLVLWAAIAYGLGSIPFGMILANLFGLGNLREIGSGNIGATNVLRTGNKAAAALTLLLDAGKGALPVLLARWTAGEDAAQVAAFFAFLGHCYPLWLGFRGGKGLATAGGAILALAWPVGLACALTWLATAIVSRISSLSALVAAGSATIWMLVLGHGSAVLLGILLTLLIFWRHRANIARLRAGTEPRIGRKSAG